MNTATKSIVFAAGLVLAIGAQADTNNATETELDTQALRSMASSISADSLKNEIQESAASFIAVQKETILGSIEVLAPVVLELVID